MNMALENFSEETCSECESEYIASRSIDSCSECDCEQPSCGACNKKNCSFCENGSEFKEREITF